MLKKKNLFDLLGAEKIASLKSINLTSDLKLKTEGNCQWAALEAAKVLLDGEYKPVSVTQVPSSYDTDPIEDHLGKGRRTKVPCVPCSNFSDLQKNIADLKNGELYLVDGENDDITHAYIILNAEHRYWLIDADRGVFKEVDPDRPEDFICEVPPWEENPEDTHLDYISYKFVKVKQGDEKTAVQPQIDETPEDSEEEDEAEEEKDAPLSMYKLTSANLDLLKKITFVKSPKDLVSDWISYIESKAWKEEGNYTVVSSLGKIKKIPRELKDIWLEVDKEEKDQDVDKIFSAFIQLAILSSNIPANKPQLHQFLKKILSDQKKYKVESGKVEKTTIHFDR